METLIPLFAIFFVIGIPVMSVAAKFVLQPLLRELTQAIRGGKAKEFEAIQERVIRLEDHLLTQTALRIDQVDGKQTILIPTRCARAEACADPRRTEQDRYGVFG